LELVLYNGADKGEQKIKIERLNPDTRYVINGNENTFTSDSGGRALLSVYLDGRTPIHIEKAG
jgi:hypothetical protein